MSVSFLLEMDTAMYGNPARHLNLGQTHLNVYPSAPYQDYSGYHPVSALGNDLHHTGSAWSPGFGLGAREDWPPPLYGHGTGHSLPVNGMEVNVIPPVDQGLLRNVLSAPLERDEPQDWMRPTAAPGHPGGKTRTKDKYRVVYSDIQRLELEKEFHFSRYITIRRKVELALSLSLSERQVKIWFQNRRAKERKMNKKRLQQAQENSTSNVPVHSNIAMVSSTNNGLMTDNISSNIKEEY
ncbi:homeobox protein CDX-1-like [Myxocyprinus asiaticus]|uniref:homeobox protein CDX-1-like n=1 Tax=Myxocyprinus asiaticus TaxID=70543 RepID=UPI002221D0E9|nr:homeobox protein CDX-1-like [Myxocyprinus asiaticus]